MIERGRGTRYSIGLFKQTPFSHATLQSGPQDSGDSTLTTTQAMQRSRPPLPSCPRFWQTLVHLLIAAILGCFPTLLLGQTTETGEIRGRVRDGTSGAYLRNAVIRIEGTDREVTSGPGGRFFIADVPAGEVTLTASYSGLRTGEHSVEVAPGEVARVDFSLASAFAAVDEPGEQPAFELQELEVRTTTRRGSARAVMEQKVALNPVKVVASDALGNISEGNVGEFLKLMPGVSLDYVEADARAVRISGLAPQYGNVLLEGLFVPSAGSSNINTGRTFEFEQLSMDSVEIVKLTKTPTPDQPSALSGTVNLVTESAFDRPGEQLDYSVGVATNSYYASLEKTEGWDNKKRFKLLPNYSLEYSNTYKDGKLGLIVGTSSHYTIAAQKHIWLWANNYDMDMSNNDTEPPVYNWIWYQDGPKPTERENYYARLDYRVSDHLSAFFRMDVSTYEASFYNRTFSLRPAEYDLGAEYSATSQTIANGRVSIDSNQFMVKKGDTAILTGGIEYQREDLSISARMNFGRARNRYENLDYGHFSDYSSSIDGISWRWERSSAGSTAFDYTQLSGPDWRDPANYHFDENSLAWHERESEDDQMTARVDFSHDWSEWHVSQELKYGAMVNTRYLDVHRWGALRTSPNGPDGIFGTADDLQPGNFVDENYTMDFEFGGNIDGIHSLSPWELYDAYESNPENFVDSVEANAAQRRQNNWYFEERTYAAYLTDIFHLGRWEIAPGLRYEYSTPSGTGYDRVAGRRISAEGESIGVLLKYLHVNYTINDDLLVRFSYHDSVTRANIANLIPGIAEINDTDREITASNPNLEEERAETYYLTVEKYFEPVGVFSASVFRRVWENRQVASRIQLGDEGYLGDPTYAGWTLISNASAGDAIDLNGLEIDYSKHFANVPRPLTHFGIFANFTVLDYEDWGFFVGSPKHTANAGIDLGVDRFSARINANHTGKILLNPAAVYDESTGEWTDAAPYVKYYQNERLFIDINLEYRINSRFRLFLDARNLTNEPSVYTYRHDEDNFERILKTGTIWKAGVKGTF